MKVAFLYEKQEPEAYSIHDALVMSAQKLGAQVVSIDAGEGFPKPCIGCFRCWIKTPGCCINRNDSGERFVQSVWDADYLIFITRILWGGYDSAVKSFADRIIPLLHPYFIRVNGEMHHKLRYGKMPVFLAAGFGARTPEEEKTFITYTNAHRDQEGVVRENGTFISDYRKKGSDNAADCAQWFEKEIAA